MNNNRVLTWIASIILIISILLCLFTLWYVISSKESLTKELKNTIEQLQKYNLPKEEIKDVTLDEAKLYLAIAKYCENTSNCEGKDGKDGASPVCIFEPSQCRGANGLTPVKGIDYTDGATPLCYFTINQCQGDDGYTPVKDVDYFDGQNGVDGREIEQQCNPGTRRIEWRYVGDESWHALYNLSPGQTCVTEG